MMHPKISVITINYNNRIGLEQTMNSVLNQTYSNLEYIVIDGGSEDGSKEQIIHNQEKLAYWISEKDEGVYDAMNKGLGKVTGTYILFLNSGDVFFDSQVVQKFVDFGPSEDFVYGDSLFLFPDGTEQLKVMPDHLEGLMILKRTLNHQCVFHRSSLFNKKRFNDEYKLLADWAFYNEEILIYGASYRHIPLTICQYDASGLTSVPENRPIMEEDRMRFYKNHADYFVPLFLESYKRKKNQYSILKNRKLVKFALKLSEIAAAFKNKMSQNS